MDQTPAESILRAIDSTEELIHNAPEVPLVDQARVPKQDLDAAVAAVREAATAEWADSDPSFSSALVDFERLAASAREIPLTRDVRLDRARAMDALDTLRGRIPESPFHAMGRKRWHTRRYRPVAAPAGPPASPGCESP
jgi:hypothetical protein